MAGVTGVLDATDVVLLKKGVDVAGGGDSDVHLGGVGTSKASERGT